MGNGCFGKCNTEENKDKNIYFPVKKEKKKKKKSMKTSPGKPIFYKDSHEFNKFS